MSRIRVGIVYFSGGQRVTVERGYTIVGYTSYDDTTAQQTYWFPDLKTFAEQAKDIFESAAAHTRPIPVFQVLPDQPEDDAAFIALRDRLATPLATIADVEAVLNAWAQESVNAFAAKIQSAVQEFLAGVELREADAPLPDAASVFARLGAQSVPVEAPKSELEIVRDKIARSISGREVTLDALATENELTVDDLRSLLGDDDRFAVLVQPYDDDVKSAKASAKAQAAAPAAETPPAPSVPVVETPAPAVVTPAPVAEVPAPAPTQTAEVAQPAEAVTA